MADMHRMENLTGAHDNGEAQFQIGLRENAFVIRRNANGEIEFVDKTTGAILPIASSTNTASADSETN